MMEIPKNKYRLWLQSRRCDVPWDELWFERLYQTVNKFGFGVLDFANLDLVPAGNLNDTTNIPPEVDLGQSPILDGPFMGTNQNRNNADPHLSFKPSGQQIQQIEESDVTSVHSFNSLEYTGEQDYPSQDKRKPKPLSKQQQECIPLIKLKAFKVLHNIKPKLTVQQKEQAILDKIEIDYQKKIDKRTGKRHIQQILRNRKQKDIIDEFYLITYQYIQKFQKQCSFLSKSCKSNKLADRLIKLSQLQFRDLGIISIDDIKLIELHIAELKQQFQNYDNKDIRYTYLGFMLEKSLYQIQLKFCNLQQEMIAIHDVLEEDPTNNENQIFDFNFVSKQIPKEQIMARYATILDKTRRYINTCSNIFNQLWTLPQQEWVLDKYFDYDPKQHIKNVSSNLYIPLKNRVKIQDETFNNFKELIISSLNINYKQHVNSAGISKRVLQKKQATIQKLWLNAKDSHIICLQEIQAGITVPSYVSYYLLYDHKQMLIQLNKLKLPAIEKDENRSGGLAIFVKLEKMHSIVNLTQGTFKEPIYFTQVLRILSNDAWVFVLNCYVFPDIYRKRVVLIEIQYLVNSIRIAYAKAKIIAIGDYNINIFSMDPSVANYFLGLLLVIPDAPTHRQAIIDYAIVSEDIEAEIRLIDVDTEHKMLRLQTTIKTTQVKRWQAVTSNKKINKLLDPEWVIFDATNTKRYISISKQLKTLLRRKMQLRKIKNPFVEFIEKINEEDLADIYCETFNQKVFLLRYMRDPKKYYSLVKKYFKLNKISPVVKQVTDNGVALTEQQTDEVLLKEYKQLYSLNRQKILHPCTPARLLISPIDMLKIRKKLDPSKAISDNLIPFSVVHINANLVYFCISLMNITTKLFPSQFFFQSRMMFLSKDKNAPIPDKNEVRPITVTSTHQKPIEHYIKDEIDYTNDDLAYSQHGFVQGQETYMNLIQLLLQLKLIEECAFEKYQQMGLTPNQYPETSVFLFFVDIKKAFDSVPHEQFFAFIKLKLNNDNHYNTVVWYFNQLGVNIGSERIPINSGTPQGSVISPMFWLIFFDSLLVMLQDFLGMKRVLCYADDLLCICLNEQEMIECKNLIDNWAITNKIQINYKTDKSAFVNVKLIKKRGRPQKKNQQQVENQQQIKQQLGQLGGQETYKYLGVPISQDLIFPMYKLEQSRDVARMLRFQKMSVRRKVSLFQVFILGKFRHTLIAIKLYPQPKLQVLIENKILSLLREVLNIQRNSPKDKLMGQSLIKGTVEGILNSADSRVLNKLQEWENKYDKYTPFNWLQYKDWFQYTEPDQVWECSINDDGFWLKLLIDNREYFRRQFCLLCKQNTGSNMHLTSCQQSIDLILIGIQQDLVTHLKYDALIGEIVFLIYNPEDFHRICQGKKTRIKMKEIFAYHLDRLSKLWTIDNEKLYMTKDERKQIRLQRLLEEQNMELLNPGWSALQRQIAIQQQHQDIQTGRRLKRPYIRKLNKLQALEKRLIPTEIDQQEKLRIFQEQILRDQDALDTSSLFAIINDKFY